jgi:hypothetical protein
MTDCLPAPPVFLRPTFPFYWGRHAGPVRSDTLIICSLLKVFSVYRVFIACLSTRFHIHSLPSHPKHDNLLVGRRFVQIPLGARQLICYSIIVMTTTTPCRAYYPALPIAAQGQLHHQEWPSQWLMLLLGGLQVVAKLSGYNEAWHCCWSSCVHQGWERSFRKYIRPCEEHCASSQRTNWIEGIQYWQAPLAPQPPSGSPSSSVKKTWTQPLITKHVKTTTSTNNATNLTLSLLLRILPWMLSEAMYQAVLRSTTTGIWDSKKR